MYSLEEFIQTVSSLLQQDLVPYPKKCMIISQLLLKEYPEQKFMVEFPRDEMIINLIDDDDTPFACFPLQEDYNWNKIKNIISNIQRKKNIRYTGYKCGICEEYKKTSTLCHECGNVICKHCTYEIVIANGGVKKCPYCRHQEISPVPFSDDFLEKVKSMLVIAKFVDRNYRPSI